MRSVCTACSHTLPSVSSPTSTFTRCCLPFVGVASMTPGQNCTNASGNREGESVWNKTKGVFNLTVHENNDNNNKTE